jgi:pantoate--beta-alanine ligase
MKVVNTIQEVNKLLGSDYAGKRSGFVPTMGALHAGHIALVERAAGENEVASASIFVNPIQFNNPDDLTRYPRTLDADLAKLEKAGCHLVFVPEVKEMYPEPSTKVYDFGMLDKVMEGEFRPGHFNGVAVVVKRLFDIMRPSRAYFGEKDYQQLQVIKALVRMESIPVEIIPCPTVREPDGLAMSSRNVRLSHAERQAAPVIYKALCDLRNNRHAFDMQECIHRAIKQIESVGVLRVEYLTLSDAETLQPAMDWSGASPIIACIAVFAGPVRLIDNLLIIS